MAPIRWLTVSAAATRLRCSVEDVQQMVAADRLHARWIGDHLSISEESVTAYLAQHRPIPVAEFREPAYADAEDAMSAHLAQHAGDPEAWPVPRDSRNPAEEQMTPADNETYFEEQKK